VIGPKIEEVRKNVEEAVKKGEKKTEEMID